MKALVFVERACRFVEPAAARLAFDIPLAVLAHALQGVVHQRFRNAIRALGLDPWSRRLELAEMVVT
ncbi:MAG: hypothetical protein ACK5MT_05885 [Actinomycetales bacterium]